MLPTAFVRPSLSRTLLSRALMPALLGALSFSLSAAGLGVSPASAVISTDQPAAFTATGTSSAVTWRVVETDGGAVEWDEGLGAHATYRAIAQPGTYHLQALADGKVATATVKVVAFPALKSLDTASTRLADKPWWWMSALTPVFADCSAQLGPQVNGGQAVSSGTTYHVKVSAPMDVTLTGTSEAREVRRLGLRFDEHGFTRAGHLLAARAYPSATLLASGKILVVGRSDSGSGGGAELYNPATRTSSPTGSPVTARSQHSATLLANGKVLILGGSDGNAPLASAETYDPAAGTFTPLGGLHRARSGHTATLLKDGKVLVTGGDDGSGGGTASAELFDPATGASEALPDMAAPRAEHTATLLGNGRVLVAGGYVSPEAELYDPATRRFLPGGALPEPRSGHTATLLPDGRVLIAAGRTGDTSARCLLYDPAARAFTAAPDLLRDPRSGHAAAKLPNGQVMIVGGYFELAGYRENYSLTYGVSDAEFYGGGAFHPTGSLTSQRSFVQAVPLKDGRVVVLGGMGYGDWTGAVEIWQ